MLVLVEASRRGTVKRGGFPSEQSISDSDGEALKLVQPSCCLLEGRYKVTSGSDKSKGGKHARTHMCAAVRDASQQYPFHTVQYPNWLYSPVEM